MLVQSLLLVFFSVATGVVGQVLLKSGIGQVGVIGSSGAALSFATLLRVVTTPLVVLGLGSYVLGAAAWIVVLSRLNLSYAYPFLALNFLLIALASRFVLGEPVPLLRWLGVAIICVGVLVVAKSA